MIHTFGNLGGMQAAINNTARLTIYPTHLKKLLLPPLWSGMAVTTKNPRLNQAASQASRQSWRVFELLNGEWDAWPWFPSLVYLDNFDFQR